MSHFIIRYFADDIFARPYVAPDMVDPTREGNLATKEDALRFKSYAAAHKWLLGRAAYYRRGQRPRCHQMATHSIEEVP